MTRFVHRAYACCGQCGRARAELTKRVPSGSGVHALDSTSFIGKLTQPLSLTLRALFLKPAALIVTESAVTIYFLKTRVTRAGG